jgi:hypothetical protein
VNFPLGAPGIVTIRPPEIGDRVKVTGATRTWPFRVLGLVQIVLDGQAHSACLHTVRSETGGGYPRKAAIPCMESVDSGNSQSDAKECL